MAYSRAFYAFYAHKQRFKFKAKKVHRENQEF